ncbi:MAG: hypothetical protein J4F42_04995 [Desulfurellaceae bacterium]|nr:hypothetical protein [Desulfurellaceae bacterium]
MSLSASFFFGLITLASSLAHATTLENPGKNLSYSGIGVISGWKCEAEGTITVRFDDDELLTVHMVYGSERGDTKETPEGEIICGDTDNGFLAIFNWALLGDGEHTAVAYDNGEEFARSTFEVGTLGEEFVREAEAEVRVEDFPSPGESTLLVWNESSQHFEVVPESPSKGECRAGLVVSPGESCSFGDSNLTFSVSAGGQGCLMRPGYTSCVGEAYDWESTKVNDLVITLVAQRNPDNSWTIETAGLESPSGFAPADQAAFDRLVVGKRAVSVDDSRYYIEFSSAGRFVEYEPGERWPGSYRYSNTGPDTGTLTQNYDDGDVCTARFTFTSATTGTSRYSCNDGEQGGGNWRLE